MTGSDVENDYTPPTTRSSRSKTNRQPMLPTLAQHLSRSAPPARTKAKAKAKAGTKHGAAAAKTKAKSKLRLVDQVEAAEPAVADDEDNDNHDDGDRGLETQGTNVNGLISPPPEETLRTLSPRGRSSASRSPTGAKRKRYPHHPSLDISINPEPAEIPSPNPKPRKQRMLSDEPEDQPMASPTKRSRTPTGPRTSPPRGLSASPTKRRGTPGRDVPEADYLPIGHHHRRSAEPVPYEAPSQTFSNPIEIIEPSSPAPVSRRTKSPRKSPGPSVRVKKEKPPSSVGRKTRSPSASASVVEAKRKKELRLLVKHEPPEIDLSKPIPPASPSDDPLLLRGREPSSRPSSALGRLMDVDEARELPEAEPDASFDFSNIPPTPSPAPREVVAEEQPDVPPEDGGASDDDSADELEYTGPYRDMLVATKSDPLEDEEEDAKIRRWGRPRSPYPRELGEDGKRKRRDSLQRAMGEEELPPSDEERVSDEEREQEVEASPFAQMGQRAFGQPLSGQTPTRSKMPLSFDTPASFSGPTFETPAFAAASTPFAGLAQMSPEDEAEASFVDHELSIMQDDEAEEDAHDFSPARAAQARAQSRGREVLVQRVDKGKGRARDAEEDAAMEGDTEEDSEEESDVDDPGVVRITADDPRAAARAAAILRMHDYDCLPKVVIKPKRRHRTVDMVRRDARRKMARDGGVGKKKDAKRDMSMSVPDLLKAAEDELGLGAGVNVTQGFSTPPANRRFGTPMSESSFGGEWEVSREPRAWAKDDWKMMDACFTDARLEAGERMGLPEGELAPVDDVSLEEVVNIFLEIMGGEEIVLGLGADWTMDYLFTRAKSLQRKHRAGIVAPPTPSHSGSSSGRRSMSPFTGLLVPDYTPINHNRFRDFSAVTPVGKARMRFGSPASSLRPLSNSLRPFGTPSARPLGPAKSAPAFSFSTPAVLQAPRYAHLMDEAVAISKNAAPSTPARPAYEEEEGEYEEEDSVLAPPVTPAPSVAPASPSMASRMKGFLFSYLPGTKTPAPAKPKFDMRNGLPLPPPEILEKPRGPIHTPVRPPEPRQPAPKELVDLHATTPKTMIPRIVRRVPQRLVELRPVSPPSSPETSREIARPRTSSGSVKDLVMSFENKGGQAAETGTLRRVKSNGSVGASGRALDKPAWKP